MPINLVHILVIHRGATDPGQVAGNVIENTAFFGPPVRKGVRRLFGKAGPPAPAIPPPLSKAKGPWRTRAPRLVKAGVKGLVKYTLAAEGAHALGRAGYGRLSQGKNYGQELVNYTPALGWRGYLDHAKLAYKYWDKSLGEIGRMFAGK